MCPSNYSKWRQQLAFCLNGDVIEKAEKSWCHDVTQNGLWLNANIFHNEKNVENI